jgi:predicted transcriptional regulator
MARTKTLEVNLIPSGTSFYFFKKTPKTKEEMDFSGIHLIRQALSNEKSRLLYMIKNENPKSIYDLSKRLGRSFKSVFQDIKFLERLGFIELIAEKTGKRARFKPVLAIDTMRINISF